jgi:hypothetical protein
VQVGAAMTTALLMFKEPVYLVTDLEDLGAAGGTTNSVHVSSPSYWIRKVALAGVHPHIQKQVARHKFSVRE